MNHLYVCSICQVEIEALAKRRRIEIDTFIKVGRGSIWEQKGRAGKWRPGKLLPVLQNVIYSTARRLAWGFPSAEGQLGNENAVQIEWVKPPLSCTCSDEQEQGVRKELRGILLENGKAALQLMEGAP